MKKFILILFSAIALSLTCPVAATSSYALTDPSITDSTPEITVSRNSLTIKADEDCTLEFEVYSITGQLVKKFRLENGRFTLELSRGYYIVKCASWSKKVIIKG